MGLYIFKPIMTTIATNLQQVRERLWRACEAASRASSEVTLLAVSKTFGPDAVRQAHAAGQHAFGENYVQEGVDKIAAVAADLPRELLQWHCIGPLQSNKTRPVAEHFDWVQSVDRLKIAQRLSEQRPATLAPLNVCIQVNIDGGPSKSGVAPADLPALRHVRETVFVAEQQVTVEGGHQRCRVGNDDFNRVQCQHTTRLLLRNGGLFVDFFFVLSGFVIAATYGDRLAQGFSLLRYAVLRLGRVWPLHIVMVLAGLSLVDAGVATMLLPPEPPLLHVHAALIEQALVNVLENAARFSPSQGRLRISVDSDAQELRFSVSDQGPGIPAYEREKIFDMFYTAARGDRGGQGTGLGLAICQGMIGAHGGRVSVSEGIDGHGATLTLHLPLHPQPALDDEQ